MIRKFSADFLRLSFNMLDEFEEFLKKDICLKAWDAESNWIEREEKLIISSSYED
jgi:hypothetical protein